MFARAAKRARLSPRVSAILGLVLGLGSLSAAGATGPTTMVSTNLNCLIRAEPSDGFLRLQAIVRAGQSTSGRYRLSVSKHSASGTSENLQSGTFNVAAHGERILTTVVLDRSAVGHYRAALSIESDLGKVSCSSP